MREERELEAREFIENRLREYWEERGQAYLENRDDDRGFLEGHVIHSLHLPENRVGLPDNVLQAYDYYHKHLFKLSNCRDSAIRDLQIQGNSSGAPSCGINSRVESPRTVASLMLEFSNLIIGSTSLNSITDGIRIDADVAGGFDQNNEQHLISNVAIQNNVNAGVLINNSNANWTKIINTNLGGGLYGVQVGTNGGNFNISHCTSGATSADFYVQGPTRRPITISQMHMENSARFLVTSATSGIQVLCN